MLTIDNCNTPEEAWVSVHQLLGNILGPVSLGIKNRREDLLFVATKARDDLINRLTQIAISMADNGYADDSEKIQSICRLINESSLTNPKAIEVIHEVSNDLSEQARSLRRI